LSAPKESTLMNITPALCPEEIVLEKYRLGELPDDERERVVAHVDGCPDCQAKLDRITGLFAAAGAAAGLVLPPPPVPGYEILGELGRGGMGVVYKARQVALNRLVALKMILAGHHAAPEQRDRFRREGEAAARVHHPNIVQIYDIGEADGLPYCSLEYVDGGTLAQQAAGRPQPPRQAAELIEVVARADHYAHVRGVIHRDLKPSNILLTASGVPKIADFGLAKLFALETGEQGAEAQARSVAVGGTPAYMAPEQCAPLPPGQTIGPAADVYALGVILYELLTGRPPLLGKTLAETFELVRYQEPVPVRRLQPEVPRDLETICHTCLAKEPGKRYRTAEALADDLRRFLDGLPIEARRSSALERGVKWARRRPGFAALLALVVAAALILVPREVMLRLEAQEQQRIQTRLRQEAESQREAAREVAHLVLVKSAQDALDHWRWEDARGRFALAIANDRPDRLDLEVKRLACLMADPRRRELRAELARLHKRTDLPPQARAVVLLYRGEVSLIDDEAKDQTAAEALIRAAVQVPGGLSPADREYALGLLAEGPRTAIKHFREALRHAPFHRANSALVLEMVFSGQFEEARRQAAFMRRINPSDIVAHYALAVIAALEEDDLGVQRHLKVVGQGVGERGRAAIERQMAFFLQLPQMNRRLHGRGARKGPRIANPLMFGAMLNEAANHVKAQGADREPGILGVPAPVLVRPRKMLKHLSAVQVALVLGNLAGAARLAEQAEREYPEALLRLQHAVAHLGLMEQQIRRRNWALVAEEARRTRALARAASTAPTIMPFGPYRHNARWLSVSIGAWEAMKRRVDFGGGVASSLGSAGSPLGLAALSETGMLAAHCRHFETERAGRNREDILAVAANSHGYDEARTALLPHFVNLLDPEDARLLLTDWSDDEPDDPTPLRLRARLELRLGNFGSALQDAQRVLARHPNDGDMRAVASSARVALEKRPR
jgi:tetratricopeptide (TPR) repeat protein/tRNA A-37 threonylcarbamoyl transferase component Bud32